MIAHDDDVLEAGGNGLLADPLEDQPEKVGSEANRAGQIGAGVVRRVGQHRHGDRVAEAQRDRTDDLASHQRVPAVDILGAALLGAAGVEQRRRFAVGQRLLYLGPGHHLELDERLLRRCGRLLGRRRLGGRRLRERCRRRQQGNRRNCGDHATHKKTLQFQGTAKRLMADDRRARVRQPPPICSVLAAHDGVEGVLDTPRYRPRLSLADHVAVDFADRRDFYGSPREEELVGVVDILD